MQRMRIPHTHQCKTCMLCKCIHTAYGEVTSLMLDARPKHACGLDALPKHACGLYKSNQPQIQKAGDRVADIEAANQMLEADIKELHGKLRKADAALERQKAAHQREVSKLNDSIRQARAAVDAMREERDSVSSMLAEANEASKKHNDIINTLRKELADKQVGAGACLSCV